MTTWHGSNDALRDHFLTAWCLLSVLAEVLLFVLTGMITQLDTGPVLRGSDFWQGRMPREQKITFGEMRESGVFGVVVFCSDFHCSHSTTLPADRWPDHMRFSDIEQQFVCQACGKRGADVRPDFDYPKMGT